jgi:hypothetical protein
MARCCWKMLEDVVESCNHELKVKTCCEWNTWTLPCDFLKPRSFVINTNLLSKFLVAGAISNIISQKGYFVRIRTESFPGIAFVIRNIQQLLQGCHDIHVKGVGHHYWYTYEQKMCDGLMLKCAGSMHFSFYSHQIFTAAKCGRGYRGYSAAKSLLSMAFAMMAIVFQPKQYIPIIHDRGQA